MRTRRMSLVGVCFAVLCAGSQPVYAEDPLHVEIDRLLEPTGPVAGKCADTEFLRRASLDILGMPPTIDETRAFLADQAPDKRQQLVDRLLARPEHARHLATTLDIMLMERRANATISQDDWVKYIHQSVVANKPYNVLAREILSATGSEAGLRPAVRFYLDRTNGEPNSVTRDVGRMFFGRDLACAQCHDSPLIDDYRQSDYHGLLAYFGGGVLVTRKEGEKQTPVNYYGEKSSNEVHFESVFIKGVKHLTGPRVLDDIELAEPVLLPGDEYTVKPADGVLPVPKFSRRAKFAELATNGSNRAFNENIANRMWAMMFGRGLVHPVDLHHSSNPPSHPELMRLLGERMATLKFDLRTFLREIALTNAYQRGLELPAELPKSSAAAKEQLTALEARKVELAAKSEAARAAFNAAIDEWNKAEAALLPVVAEVDKARAVHADAAGKLVPLEKKIADATTALTTKRSHFDVFKAAADATAASLAKLPNDTDLKAANTTLAARLQTLTAELPPLEKAVADAQAAAKPQQDAVANAQQAFAAAAQKAAPFRDAVRVKEQDMLGKRREMILVQTGVSRTDKRIETLKIVSEFEKLQAEFASATQIVQAQTPVLPGEKQKLTDAVALMTLRQTEHKAAAETKAAAEKALTEFKTSLASQQATSASVTAALAQAQAALGKIPNDAAIVEAIAKLKARNTDFESQVVALKPKVDAATVAMTDATTKEQVALTNMNAAVEAKTKLDKSVAELEAALNQARETMQQRKGSIDDSVTTLTTRWGQDFSVANLKPLTPEQMCWSILRVTSIYDRQRAAEEAELNKKTPLSEEAKKDPAQLAARALEIEQNTFNKLKPNVGAFVNVYGAGTGQPQGDFFATADQALFAANGGVFTSWASPSGGNVTERVIAQADPKLAAQDLYLTIFVRMPTEAEVNSVSAYLAGRPQDRAVAAQELVWAMLTSAEFRFGY